MIFTYLPSTKGFLGLSSEDAGSPEKARAVLIPFGLEKSVSYKGGTAKGPLAILKASPELEFYDDELGCEGYKKYGVATRKPEPIKKDMKAALHQLEDIVNSVLDVDKFPLILGGEHSLTAGAIRPFAKRHKALTILHFDAHADLRDGYEGEPYSHAAAMRRCLDFPNVKLVSVGIRNISAGEMAYLTANKGRISIFWAREKARWKMGDILRAVGSGPVYVSFDIDAFDSSLMPATGTPEPGGLFWDETLTILRNVFKKCKIVGADVVELAPHKGLHACDFVAAKLCYKMLNYRFCR